MSAVFRLEMPARVSDYYCPVNLYLKKEVLCVPCLNLSISLHSKHWVRYCQMKF
jgi:hypothetical protein